MDVTAIFAALADPTRLRIVEMLAERGALSVQALNEPFSISAPAVSQHLKVLRDREIVLVERQAQRRIYRLRPEILPMLARWNKRLMGLKPATKSELVGFLAARAGR